MKSIGKNIKQLPNKAQQKVVFKENDINSNGTLSWMMFLAT
jgi:hypothetical protein